MNLLPPSESGTDQNQGDFLIIQQSLQFKPKIDALLDRAFGADRFKKSSYKLRETCLKVDQLCKVAVQKTDKTEVDILASIEFWQLQIGDKKGLLLGPLAVEPKCQGMGIGRELIESGLVAAENIAKSNGWNFVILIGDLDYYVKSGFKMVPQGMVDYPQPVDFNRILYKDFEPNFINILLKSKQLPLKINQNL